MAKHFIAVLGISNYEPVYYGDQGITSFVQVALLEKFHSELSEEGSRITILLTEKARSCNWEDRGYNTHEFDVMNERWPKSVRPGSHKKRGLKSEIEEKLPDLAGKVNTVSIPDGKSEEEIWEIFQKLYDEINEGDEIIFDITHGFRSIPMLAMTVINYAGVMKDCEVAGIYYGAFEASQKDEAGVKHAPIFDLGIYNEIIQWTYAADTLKKDGNPREINRILKARERNMEKAEKKRQRPVSEYTYALTTLAESLNTCRGVKLDIVEAKSAKRSINAAYKKVKEKQGEAAAAQADIKEAGPFYELLHKTEESFSEFDTDINYETGMAAVRWYINNDMVQQGSTALEETAITFLCYYYGLDETREGIRDDIVGKAANIINYYKENKKSGEISESDREEIWQSYIKDDKSQKALGQDDTFAKIREIVMTLPASYAELIGKIKGIRNDINHFGMRANPMPSDRLGTNLKTYYNALSEEIRKMEDTMNSRG